MATAVFIAFGTQGDVQPIALVAQLFSVRRNHKVRFVTHRTHKKWLLHTFGAGSDLEVPAAIDLVWVDTPAIASRLESSSSGTSAAQLWSLKQQRACFEAISGVQLIAFNLFSLEGLVLADLSAIPAVALHPYPPPSTFCGTDTSHQSSSREARRKELRIRLKEEWPWLLDQLELASAQEALVGDLSSSSSSSSGQDVSSLPAALTFDEFEHWIWPVVASPHWQRYHKTVRAVLTVRQKQAEKDSASTFPHGISFQSHHREQQQHKHAPPLSTIQRRAPLLLYGHAPLLLPRSPPLLSSSTLSPSATPSSFSNPRPHRRVVDTGAWTRIATAPPPPPPSPSPPCTSLLAAAEDGQRERVKKDASSDNDGGQLHHHRRHHGLLPPEVFDFLMGNKDQTHRAGEEAVGSKAIDKAGCGRVGSGSSDSGKQQAFSSQWSSPPLPLHASADRKVVYVNLSSSWGSLVESGGAQACRYFADALLKAVVVAHARRVIVHLPTRRAREREEGALKDPNSSEESSRSTDNDDGDDKIRLALLSAFQTTQLAMESGNLGNGDKLVGEEWVLMWDGGALPHGPAPRSSSRGGGGGGGSSGGCSGSGNSGGGFFSSWCCCVMHHGGSGTCLAAASAGVPQVCIPFFFDQFTWASQVSKLGIGASTTTTTGGAAAVFPARAATAGGAAPADGLFSFETSLLQCFTTALAPGCRLRAACFGKKLRDSMAIPAAALPRSSPHSMSTTSNGCGIASGTASTESVSPPQEAGDVSHDNRGGSVGDGGDGDDGGGHGGGDSGCRGDAGSSSCASSSAHEMRSALDDAKREGYSIGVGIAVELLEKALYEGHDEDGDDEEEKGSAASLLGKEGKEVLTTGRAYTEKDARTNPKDQDEEEEEELWAKLGLSLAADCDDGYDEEEEHDELELPGGLWVESLGHEETAFLYHEIFESRDYAGPKQQQSTSLAQGGSEDDSGEGRRGGRVEGRVEGLFLEGLLSQLDSEAYGESVVVDVGANIGLFAIWLHRQAVERRLKLLKQQQLCLAAAAAAAAVASPPIPPDTAETAPSFTKEEVGGMTACSNRTTTTTNRKDDCLYPSFRLLCVEPAPMTCAALRRNLERHASHAEIAELALVSEISSSISSGSKSSDSKSISSSTGSSNSSNSNSSSSSSSSTSGGGSSGSSGSSGSGVHENETEPHHSELFGSSELWFLPHLPGNSCLLQFRRERHGNSNNGDNGDGDNNGDDGVVAAGAQNSSIEWSKQQLAMLGDSPSEERKGLVRRLYAGGSRVAVRTTTLKMLLERANVLVPGTESVVNPASAAAFPAAVASPAADDDDFTEGSAASVGTDEIVQKAGRTREIARRPTCRVALLKIDVEGSELEVLKGLGEGIEWQLVDRVVVEVHDVKNSCRDSSPKEGKKAKQVSGEQEEEDGEEEDVRDDDDSVAAGVMGGRESRRKSVDHLLRHQAGFSHIVWERPVASGSRKQPSSSSSSKSDMDSSSFLDNWVVFAARSPFF